MAQSSATVVMFFRH